MIVRRDALQAIDFVGLKIFDYSAEAGLSCSLATIEVPVGGVHPEAFSRRSDKYYLVLTGEVELSLEGKSVQLGPGDFCFVEQGKRFAYKNEGSEPARLVLVHSPSFELDSEVMVEE